jgi:hypothetical protein
MGKSKKPRKPKPPPPDQSPSDEEQPRSLVPARRSEVPSQPVRFEWIQTVRNVVGTLLDIADAAAEAITKRLEGRA